MATTTLPRRYMTSFARQTCRSRESSDRKPALKSAIAEGGILCAERMMKDGNNDFAAQIYDVIRAADLPKPRILRSEDGAQISDRRRRYPLCRAHDEGWQQRLCRADI